MGRGARSVAQRPVPLQSGSAEFSEDRRREIAKTAVRSHGVVVVFPSQKSRARMRQRREQRLVEQLIAQPPIEAFDKGILLRLAGGDVVPLDAVLVRAAQH